MNSDTLKALNNIISKGSDDSENNIEGLGDIATNALSNSVAQSKLFDGSEEGAGFKINVINRLRDESI